MGLNYTFSKHIVYSKYIAFLYLLLNFVTTRTVADDSRNWADVVKQANTEAPRQQEVSCSTAVTTTLQCTEENPVTQVDTRYRY